MTHREVLIAPVDLGLLWALSRSGSLTEACHTVGLSRDRGVYRLRRLRRAAGTAIVRSERGGAVHGVTKLTAAGRALLERRPGDAVDGPRGPPGEEAGATLSGSWRAGDPPTVRLPRGPTLRVAFSARSGEKVQVHVDPEAVLLAAGRFPTSARNVLPASVVGVRPVDPDDAESPRWVELRVGAHRLVASVTLAAVRALRLARGRRVYAYVKATAVRRRDPPTRGSLRS